MPTAAPLPHTFLIERRCITPRRSFPDYWCHCSQQRTRQTGVFTAQSVALIRHFPAKPQGVLRPPAQLQLSHKNNNETFCHQQYVNEVKHGTKRNLFSFNFVTSFSSSLVLWMFREGAAEFRILCTSWSTGRSKTTWRLLHDQVKNYQAVDRGLVEDWCQVELTLSAIN